MKFSRIWSNRDSSVYRTCRERLLSRLAMNLLHTHTRLFTNLRISTCGIRAGYCRHSPARLIIIGRTMCRPKGLGDTIAQPFTRAQHRHRRPCCQTCLHTTTVPRLWWNRCASWISQRPTCPPMVIVRCRLDTPPNGSNGLLPSLTRLAIDKDMGTAVHPILWAYRRCRWPREVPLRSLRFTTAPLDTCRTRKIRCPSRNISVIIFRLTCRLRLLWRLASRLEALSTVCAIITRPILSPGRTRTMTWSCRMLLTNILSIIDPRWRPILIPTGRNPVRISLAPRRSPTLLLV